MAFADDEKIIPSPNQQVGKVTGRQGTGKVTLQPVEFKKKAPLTQTNFKALVKFNGDRSTKDRSGADIVTVMDVSGSMGGEKKLEKLKLAMKFLIKKLGPQDRLSIVSFSTTSTRLCPLRLVNSTSQSEIEELVDGLEAKGSTNITAGLETALQVLKDRTLHEGRVGAIMLMSDGKEDKDGNGAGVDTGNVPVHTFGFGKEHDPEVLDAIAKKSIGGTFSVVDVEYLAAAFSQILGGLLTVVAQDVKITVTPLRSKIENKELGSIQKIHVGYPKSKTDPDSGSITISFGDLYANETREFLVNLLLLPFTEPVTEPPPVFTVLRISGTYRLDGKELSMKTKDVQVEKSTKWEEEPESEAVRKEEIRQDYINNLIKAAELAEAEKNGESKDLLLETKSDMEDSLREFPKNKEIQKLCDGCIFELKIATRYLDSDTYKTKGRSFFMATLTCHERQRFSVRIDPEVMSVDEEKLRIFATPRMDTYLVQALVCIKNPGKPVPNSEDDAKEETEADPLGPFAGSIGSYLETAIQALQAIQEMLKPPTSKPRLTAP